MDWERLPVAPLDADVQAYCSHVKNVLSRGHVCCPLIHDSSFIHSWMENSWSKSRNGRTFFQARGQGHWLVTARSPRLRHPWKRLRSKGSYIVISQEPTCISLRHYGVTWDAHARCWSVCLQYCEWILPFFKGNLQHHHFVFIVYYQGRKVSSSFLWLNSFFPQSGLFPSNMFDEDNTPTVHAAGTADEGQNEGVTCPYCTLPPVSFVLFFFLYHSRWILITNGHAHVM